MGKIPTNKKVYRVDPTSLGGATNNNNQQQQQDSSLVDAIRNDDIAQALYNCSTANPQQVFELMDDPSSNERDVAFRTLCELILENPQFLKSITAQNLTKVIQHFVDSDVQVRVSAIGALRNLTIIEPKSIETLLQLDILTPTLSNITISIDTISKSIELRANNNIIGAQHILLQSISLLTNICEESDKAFEFVSKSLLAQFPLLFKVLGRDGGLIENLSYHVAEFLAVITENNPPLALSIGQDVLIGLYQSVSQSTTMSIRIKSLASSSLLNIGAHYQSRDKVIETLTPILLTSFSTNPVQGLIEISQIVDNMVKLKEMADIKKEDKDEIIMKMKPIEDQEQEQIDERDDDDDDDEDEDEEMGGGEKNGNNNNKLTGKNNILKEIQVLEKQLETVEEQWKDVVAAIQSTVELFTNIVSQDGEESNNDEMDNTYDDDDKFLDVEDGNTTMVEESESSLIKYLASTTLLQNLIEIIKVIDEFDGNEYAKKYSELVSLVVALKNCHKRSLTCLSNLLISYKPAMVQPHQETIWNLLIKIASHSIKNGQLSQAKVDLDQFETATASLWSLLRINNQIGFNNIEEIKNLFLLTLSAPVSIKTNLIGMVGILGQRPICQPMLSDIGQLLIQCLKDSNAQVVGETLNSIFDIYAEPPVNAIFKQLGMLQVLEQFVPILRNKIKTEKKTLDRHLLDRLDESRINLTRFISYKKAQK
ncbi:armadillo repeat-containing protein [Cavenderia fasciculata]|uniref:Armadillo repeat-containing protein n=1 Tax=Cavenderia fasciculata TaxID=261658 RepID=F4PVJ8_CACFS|nr:armadillo repeat-containing protein [Cavenderia fasciculata]EGG20012.1 armadillo repeat-containing protein [Cavenderia fasciculata]|eukprot:XP_004366995.1 armadillo repeat-containing protein [Cavenderia fasciculata]